MTSDQQNRPDLKPNLMIVVASVREGRIGKAVADWFVDYARAHDAFNVTVADLKEIDLPLMTEPNYPSMKMYMQEKTRIWSAMVDAADAFVFVTPEYNYAPPASLINAIDYLSLEWAFKPVGLLSYGFAFGGLGAAQALKPLIASMRMMPLMESVNIQMVTSHIDPETGTFAPIDLHESYSTIMLDALVQWEKAMHHLRMPSNVTA